MSFSFNASLLGEKQDIKSHDAERLVIFQIRSLTFAGDVCDTLVFYKSCFGNCFFAAQQDLAVCPLELRSSNLQGSILRWWVNATVFPARRPAVMVGACRGLVIDWT